MVSVTSTHPPATMQRNTIPQISIPPPPSSSSCGPTALPQCLDPDNHTSGMVQNNNNNSYNSYSSTNSTSSPAVDSAITAYASRLLKSKSPPEACIDSSVGPYVTSILKCALLENSSLSSLDIIDANTLKQSLTEYTSLMELLEEHCSMSPQVAQSVLTSIAKAVKTGVFDAFEDGIIKKTSLGSSFGSLGGMEEAFGHHSMGGRGRFRSKSLGAEHDLLYNNSSSIAFLGNLLESTYVTAHSTRQRSNSLILQPPCVEEDVDEDDCSLSRDNSYEEEVDQSFVLEEDPVPISKESHPNSDANTLATVDTNVSTLGNNWLPSHNTVTSTTSYNEQRVFSNTPLKPDRLIPVDLLGVIDDPSTPAGKQGGSNPWSDVISNSIGIMNSPQAIPKDDKTSDTSTSTPTNTIKPEQNKSSTTTDNPPPSSSSSCPSTEIPTKSSVPTTTETAPAAPVAPVASVAPVGKGKKKTKTKASDLAATLFAPSARSRSNSIMSEKSPKLKPMSAPPPSVLGMAGMSYSSTEAVMNNSIPALFNKQMESAVEILMAMNFDLCEDAAYNAVLVSNADVNIAQHVIDGALAQPPVCRHMLNGGCYRSDCTFSHDVDGHTCLFWLRGRCGKGEDGCRFMHGFSEKLLEGMKPTSENDPSPQQQQQQQQFSLGEPAQISQSSVPIPIKTANLVQHNIKTSFSLGKDGGGSSLSQSPKPQSFNGYMGRSDPQSKGSSQCRYIDQQTATHSMNSSSSVVIPPRETLIPPVEKKSEETTKPSTFSFASIASKGYSSGKSFNSTSQNAPITALSNNSNNNKPNQSVRIPQDLWNPNINRSPAAFHIADPMARYNEVSQSVQRKDVIDLHYQSVKTFAVVLRSFLPEKLRNHGEVWVVTGSGHHVNRNSHQKSGGVLETAVNTWLLSNGYKFVKGRDKNGFGGAILVKR